MMKLIAAAATVAVCASACSSPDSHNVPTAPSSDAAPGIPAARPRYPHTGEALVEFVVSRYPEKLAATADFDSRAGNMAFLRDRIIEAGICGGLDLARNLKRGVGPHSIDAVAWRPDGVTVEVVDIAASYDDFSRPLVLQWIVVGGPAGWDPIGEPACERIAR